MARHNTIGNIGENIATRFLQSKGHRILDRNYRKKWGEVDIVSRENRVTHFVEVKTISRENGGVVSQNAPYHRPEENLHGGKLLRLRRVVETYIENENIKGDWQLDLVAVELLLKDKKAVCRLIENVL
tara:strand:- start:1816 stop:2199 length:384 start_codon:yes stop_codon:yes gene_type:complete